MRANSLAVPMGGYPLTAGMILIVGAFLYVFLGAAPVAGVIQLHSTFGLKGLISLDGFSMIGHVGVYGLLTLSLCAVCKSTKLWPAVAVTLSATGIAIEFLQEFYFGRNLQIGDMISNMIGIAAAMIFLTLFTRRGRMQNT